MAGFLSPGAVAPVEADPSIRAEARQVEASLETAAVIGVATWTATAGAFPKSREVADAVALADRVVGFTEGVLARAAAIRDTARPDLSPEGVTRAIAEEKAKAASEAAVGLAGLDRAVLRLRGQLESWVNNLAGFTKEPSTAVEAARDSFIWGRVADMDHMAIYALCCDLIASGDLATLDAIHRLPRVLCPNALTDEQRQKLRMARALTAAPEAAAEIDLLTVAVSWLEAAVSSARQAAERAFGQPGADPVAMLAAGDVGGGAPGGRAPTKDPGAPYLSQHVPGGGTKKVKVA